MTWSTVRNSSGARIFAVWGAKTGEATTTSAVGPSATMSPSATTTTRSAARGELDIVGGDDHRTPFACQRADDVDESALGTVVETAGRFVEQQGLRGGGEPGGEDRGEFLPLGQVTGMGGVVDTGSKAVREGTGAPSCRGFGVRLVEFLPHALRVEEVGGGLRHQSDEPAGVCRGDGVRVRSTSAVPDGDRAGTAWPRALQGPQQGGLAGAVAPHQRGHLAFVQGEVHLADGRHPVVGDGRPAGGEQRGPVMAGSGARWGRGTNRCRAAS